MATALMTEEQAAAYAAALLAAQSLRERGYIGHIYLQDMHSRIELLATPPGTPWRTLHLTWHPQGMDKEILPMPLEEAKEAIEV